MGGGAEFPPNSTSACNGPTYLPTYLTYVYLKLSKIYEFHVRPSTTFQASVKSSESKKDESELGIGMISLYFPFYLTHRS